MVAVGDTVTTAPLIEPGFQRYVFAPDAVSVVLPPVQIVLLEAVAVTLGKATTLIVLVAVFVQPFTAVPVTVYVVVLDGVTTTEEPVMEPGIHK